jgi:hypothetical protein
MCLYFYFIFFLICFHLILNAWLLLRIYFKFFKHTFMVLANIPFIHIIEKILEIGKFLLTLKIG